jgi:outer membrane protein OmpA-like peptidoglycan-associated protein
MKNIKSLLFVLIIIFASIEQNFSQQNIKIKKSEFKIKETGFKEAWKSVKKGNNFYELKGVYYLNACDEYKKAYQYNNNNPALKYKLGICLLMTGKYEEAEKLLTSVTSIKPFIAKDVLFYAARACHMNYNFEKAIELYMAYKNTFTNKELKKQSVKIDKFIVECNNGIELLKNPAEVYIENISSINTEYPEYYPVLTRNEKNLYFSSRRPKSKKDKVNIYDRKYYEDVFVADFDGKEIKNPKILDQSINTQSNEVAVATSFDDNILYIYKGNKNNGDILQSVKKKNQWQKVKSIDMPVNTKKFQETSLTFSSDDKMAFFVSDNDDDNVGGKDIYMTVKSGKKWSNPQNIVSLNSTGDEEGVFFYYDNKTLYFSSKGHNSMGGYDIFKAEMNEKGEWSKPVNLGYPINTPGDDIFFTYSKDKRTAFYSSNGQKDGKGDFDIYKILFLGPEKPMNTENIIDSIAYYKNKIKISFIETTELSTKNVTILKGIIKDQSTKQPVKANIEIIDNEKNELISELTSDSISGQYFITLSAGKKYGISVNSKGYLFYSEYIDIPITAKYEEIEKDIEIIPISLGVKLVLKNIFFATNKSELQPQSYVELGFVVKLLKENPTIKIEISGHTDNVGRIDKNMKLSQERAKSVVNYLIGNGIEPSRLTAKGYGPNQPVAPNNTDEGRQLNRRVEFKVIGE